MVLPERYLRVMGVLLGELVPSLLIRSLLPLVHRSKDRSSTSSIVGAFATTFHISRFDMIELPMYISKSAVHSLKFFLYKKCIVLELELSVERLFYSSSISFFISSRSPLTFHLFLRA